MWKTGNRWTPYDLELFLHHATSHAKFDRWQAPLYKERLNKLVEAGLLVKVNDAIYPDAYDTTKLGDSFMEHLLCTEIPTTGE